MTKTGPIRLIIADDHEIYRDGLKIMLKKEKDFTICGEAGNGRELIALAQKFTPDIVLTDIVMPVVDGVEATRNIVKLCPSVNIIALSMFDQDNLIMDMLEAGAKGYLLKNADKAEIIEAIKTVYSGLPYYCCSTSHKLAKIIGQSRFNPEHKPSKSIFTDNETKIITLICREYTNKEIGVELFLGTRTVEGYRRKIMEKMNVKSPAGIVIYAIQNGLFKPGNKP